MLSKPAPKTISEAPKRSLAGGFFSGDGLQSLPLVPKGRWQAEGLTEGIRASDHRRLTTPQSAYG